MTPPPKRGKRGGGGVPVPAPPLEVEPGRRPFLVSEVVAVVGEAEGDMRFYYIALILEKGVGAGGRWVLLHHYEREDHGRRSFLFLAPGPNSDKWKEEEASLIHVTLEPVPGRSLSSRRLLFRRAAADISQAFPFPPQERAPSSPSGSLPIQSC